MNRVIDKPNNDNSISMNNFFDNQRILEIIWKRRIHIVVIAVFAVIASAVFSGPTFIQPKFKSTARIYPTNLWTLSDESETEQMLEVLNSTDIKLKMFEAFNLSEAYKINKEDPFYLTYMMDEYGSNVSAGKTEFETVEIKVMDQSPTRACQMCDSIIHFYNLKVREMHKAKDWEMVEITQQQLVRKKNELDSIGEKLDAIRKEYGIISFQGQVPELTRGYMSALAAGRGNTADTRKIEKMYESFSKAGTEAYRLERKYNKGVSLVDSLQLQYETHLMEFNKDITYSHVVEKPIPADKKSYPVRWLIVFFTLASSIFVSILAFLILDYKKKS